ncbi:MAG: hypothetical protein Q7W30_00095 [Coriobacteriia bacterium]|nr:hypothetical protein [Coriobacteriia bacterium]
MNNVSIRTKILTLVVLVNILGALVVVVYLHETFSGGLAVTAQKSLTLGENSFAQLQELGADELGSIEGSAGIKYLESMKGLLGYDFGLMLDKSMLDEKAYGAARTAAGLPNNWSEGGDTYVLAATTDEAMGQKMQLTTPPGDIAEEGKIVGIENGACSQMCHDGVKGTGDFWTVRWSTDSKSRAHSVFPIKNEAGKTIGVLYAIDDISPQADADKASMIQTLLVIGITLLVATLAIGGMLDVFVFRRLSAMITSMEELSVRVAGGDFDAHFVPSGSNDEIGRFEQFFANFLDLVSMTLKSLIGGK